MKLKEYYGKLYDKIFSYKIFKSLLKIPGLEKLLQYEVISYLFFGVMTTAVNFVMSAIMNKLGGKDYDTRVLFTVFGIDIMWAYLTQTVAWIVSVLFAYITNKLLVFESKVKNAAGIIKELISFFGARIISFLVFELGAFSLMYSVLGLNYWIVKIIVGILVVIFNFVASKLVIFRKKTSGEG